MLFIKNRLVSIMILYAVGLHFIWGVALLFDKQALGATAIAALYKYIPVELLIPVLFLTAISAAIATLFPKSLWILLLLLPQQAILLMSAAGAIEAIWLSQFADGVVRSRAFIFVDQVPAVLAAIGHTTAIIAHALRVEK